MAINHATAGSDFGKYLQAADNLRKFRDDATGAGITIKCVQVWQDEMEAQFDADVAHRKIILPTAIAWTQGVRVLLNTAIRDLFNGPVRIWMQEWLRDQLGSSGRNVSDIVRDWNESMVTDSRDVEELTITVGAVVVDADNAGDGTLTVIALEPIEGRPDETVHTETLTVRCRVDSFFSGATPGTESFLASGTVHRGGQNVVVKHTAGINDNRVANGGFEDITGSALDGWTAVTGAFGTELKQSLSVFRRDLASAEIDGNGSDGTIEMKQLETAMAGYAVTARLKPRRFYQINAQIKTDNGTGVAGSDTFTILFDGTGYSTGAGEKITITGADSADWTEYKATVHMPKSMPSDMALHIQYAGTPAAGAEVFVDDLVVQEFTIWEGAGVAFAVTRGPTADFAAGPQQDYWTVPLTNSEDKIFQRWLIKITDENVDDIRTWPGINRMLPSAASAHADYAEAKAA